MPRIKNPTHDNVFAARTQSPAAAAAAVQALAEAAKPLSEIAKRQHATPSEIVSAVAKMRGMQPAVYTAMYDLLGLAVLGGAAVTTTARAVGLRPETLSRHLIATAAARRGETDE